MKILEQPTPREPAVNRYFPFERMSRLTGMSMRGTKKGMWS